MHKYGIREAVSFLTSNFKPSSSKSLNYVRFLNSLWSFINQKKGQA